MICALKVTSAERLFQFGLFADISSKYIWRGQNLNEAGVLQPAVSITAYGLSASLWSNIDLTDRNNNAGQVNEVDLTLDYTGDIRGVEILAFAVGAIHYRFPNTSFSPTTELYGGVAAEIILSPTIKFYNDVGEIEGSCLMFGIEHCFEKLFKHKNKYYCDLQLAASTALGSPGYNQGYFGIEKCTFNDLTLAIGLPISLSHLTIRPGIYYSTIVSQDIRRVLIQPDNFWFGLSMMTSF